MKTGQMPPFSLIREWMLVIRSESVSSLTKPPSAGMSELSDLDPALWSLMSHSLDNPFLGAVKMGCTVIPGSKRAPKPSKYWLSLISRSHCCLRKSTNSSLRSGEPPFCMTTPTGCCPGSSISVNGQNLLQKPSQMDLTKVQFGCWDRMHSSSSTQTGVTTSNRCGYLAIVSLMSLYWKSLQGTAGTGKAVSVYVVEGV